MSCLRCSTSMAPRAGWGLIAAVERFARLFLLWGHLEAPDFPADHAGVATDADSMSDMAVAAFASSLIMASFPMMHS